MHSSLCRSFEAQSATFGGLNSCAACSYDKQKILCDILYNIFKAKGFSFDSNCICVAIHNATSFGGSDICTACRYGNYKIGTSFGCLDYI